MITGFAPASAFAAMIAPRKLQSLGAAVQAVAAAVSSVRSTVSVVAKARLRLEVAIDRRETAVRWLDELENGVRGPFRRPPAKTASINIDKAIFLFIVMLQPD